MSIIEIVSGGQTGANQGALDGAICYGLDYGGWIPKGRKAEKGSTIPEKYEYLREMASPDYLKRNEANVVGSDATLIFSYGILEGGSLRTAEFAQRHKRPYLHVDLDKLNREQAVQAIVAWIREKCPDRCRLNAAGSRESTHPGIQKAVEFIVVDVLNEINGFKVSPQSDSTPG